MPVETGAAAPERFLVPSRHDRGWRVDEFYPDVGKVDRMIELPFRTHQEAGTADPGRFGVQVERDLGKRSTVAVEELVLAYPFALALQYNAVS